MKIFTSSRTTAIAAGIALASIPAVAIAAPIEIGERNPSGGQSVEAKKETEIIAETARGTYGTRQSNKGAGGGAIYGCRSSLQSNVFDPDVSTPCIRVNNLSGGKAFDFVFNTGPIGGIIQSGNSLLTPKPNAAPFITNATAIALGLNADRLDNKHASEIIAEASADAKKVGGLTAAEIIAAGQQGGGACPDGTVKTGDACIETTARENATWDAASAACAQAGRHLPSASELTAARLLDGVNLGGGEISADVTAAQTIPLPDPLGVITSTNVYATVAEDGTVGSEPLTQAGPYRCIVG